jgi:hypothetical protein
MSKERKTRATAKKAALPPPKREPSAAERRAIEQARGSFATLPARCELSMKVEGHKVELGTSPHSDQDGYGAHLFASFGTASGPFLDGAITQLLKASAARGKVATEREANAGLAFVSAVGPTNELECSMALQMHATNELALELLNRAHHASDRGATVEYTNLATKLTRTFVTQVEALAKLRRNGEQVVKHVHVYDGGQAVVVGTINQGGQIGKRNGSPHAKAADAPFAALPGPDATLDAMSVASDAERAVQDARG